MAGTSGSFERELNAEALDDWVEALRDFIDRIHQPRPTDSGWIERIRIRGQELGELLASRSLAANDKHEALYESMAQLVERVRDYTDELAESPSMQVLRRHKKMLAASYEEFLLELKRRRISHAVVLTRSRNLKPVNLARNLFHAATGLLGVTAYWFLLSRTQALIVLGSLLGLFAALEASRVLSKRWNDFLVDKVFGLISRPAERYRVNSATLYLTALLVIVFFFPKPAVLAAAIVLALADPVASLVGKRWGARKLFRDKSYVGTGAFFVTGLVAASLFLLVFDPGMGLGRVAGVAALVAAVGAGTEVFSSRIDDNLSIPIACAAAGALVM